MKKLLLLAAVALSAVCTFAQDMYVIGSNVNGKSWTVKAEDGKFTDKGGGIYEWSGQTLGTGFKFNDGSWSGKYNLGSNGKKLVQGEPYKLNNSGASGNIALDGVTEVVNPHIVLDINELTVTITGGFDGEIKWYVCGFNGSFIAEDTYGAVELFPTETEGVYLAEEFVVTEATGEFKIASTGWATEYGTNDPENVKLGTGTMKLQLEEVFGEAGNVPYSLAPGTYDCEFNLNDLTVKFDDHSGVSDVKVDNDAAPEYYNLQGIRVERPAAGSLYIEVRGAKATKHIAR